MYALLDAQARASLSKQDVQRLLKESQAQLLRRVRSFGKPTAKISTTARVRTADGEVSTLVLEQDEFRVTAAGALPAAGITPAEALSELRRALARRSYPALVQVLSADSRSALEEQLSGLVVGLEQPESLHIVIDGETARVTTPGGHWVELSREDGVWRVRDFE